MTHPTAKDVSTVEPSPLMGRLAVLQRRALRLMLWHGLAVVLGVCAGGLLVLIALDWLVRFPGAVRLAFALGGLGVLSWLIAGRVWPALAGQLTTVRLAGRIEECFEEFDDRLISAVSFAAQEEGVRDPLQQKLLERTEAIVRDVPIEQVITVWPVWRALLCSAVPIGLLVAMCVLQPGWISLGLKRYLVPVVAEEWPRTVEIRPLTADLSVPLGESAVVSMEIVRGREQANRGMLYVRALDGTLERIVMRREGDDRFAWTLSDVTEDLSYWFQAGDDTTVDQVSRIRVVQRPWVKDLQLILHPPPYIDGGAPRALPAGRNTVTLTAGSRLGVRFRSSKAQPVGDDDQPAAWLTTADQRTLAVTCVPDGTCTVELAPQIDQVYQIHVIDYDGLENSDPATLSVRVRRDDAPIVMVSEPGEHLEVTPKARIQVAATARDDFGISRIVLQGHVGERPFETRLQGWTAVPEHGSVVARITHEWALAALNLTVGDTVSYVLQVHDNRLIDDAAAQIGRTPTLVLRVLSESQFIANVADELSTLATRLQRVLARQEQLIDQTDAAYDSLTAAPQDDFDRTLMRLSARQRGVAEQVAAIRRSVARLLGFLAQNDITMGREKQQGDVMATQLRNVVEPLQQQAAGELNNARATDDPAERARQVAGASERQRQAADAIALILNEFSVWDDYNSALVNLRSLIDLQQQVAQQTAVVQEKTLGADLADVPETVRGEVRAVSQAQDGVTDSLDRMLVEMQRLHDKLERVEPEDARVLAETATRLRSNQVAQRSRAAARAVAENRTGQAQAEQNAVERTLAEAVNQLEDRLSRKLAELSKKMAHAEDILLLILQQQQALGGDTAATDPEDREQWRPLAVRQRKLRNNTAQAAADLGRLPQTGAAMDATRRAVADMAEAAEAIYEHRRDAAEQAQDQAIADLEQAVALLQELRRNNEESMRKQKLVAIRRELLGIRKLQGVINSATRRILEAVSASGRLTRIDVRRGKKEGRRQQQLDQKLRTIQERLADAPVYAWVAARVQAAMQTSAERLQRGALEPELQQIQVRIVRYLDHLINAVQQAESLATDDFSGGPGGGGGGGQGAAGQKKAVPTVAELLVLKTLQEELLQRSELLDTEIQEASPTESQLEQARMLGDEQQELRTLTKMLTERAQRQGPE